MEPRVIQVGNYRESEDRKFDNPQCGRVYSVDGLSPTINTCQGGDREPKILLEMEEIKSCASRKRGDEHKIETRKDEIANCVTSIDTDSMVQEPVIITDPYSAFGEIRENRDVSPTLRARDYKSPHLVAEPLKIPQATKQGYIECPVGGVFDASYPDSELRRERESKRMAKFPRH